MKNLIPFTIVLFLLVQTIGHSQEKDAILKEQNSTTQIDTELFKSSIGKYLLEEGDFELEITMEDNKIFILSPFSKDPLIQKNETTLREPSRGVDLELIADNKDALKFTQNGYETIIKRVTSTTAN